MRLSNPYLWVTVVALLIIGMISGAVIRQGVGFAAFEVGNKPKDESSDKPQPGSAEGQRKFDKDLPKTFEQFPSTPAGVEELLADADHFVDTAQYEKAIVELQQVIPLHGESGRGRLYFKLAACQEMVGQDEVALENYQAAINSSQDRLLQTVSRLGKCRIWRRHGKSDLARNELFDDLLSQREIRADAVEARLKHELAASTVEALHKNQPNWSQNAGENSQMRDRLLDDRSLHLPRPLNPAEQIIAEAVRNVHINDGQPSDATTGIQHVLKLDDSVETILLAADFPTVSVKEFLEQTTTAAGLSLSIDEACFEQINQRVLSANFQGLPLAVALDAVLLPLECAWQQTGKQLDVHAQVDEAYLHASAQRLLRYAISMAPEHDLAPYSSAAQAILLHDRGDVLGALREFERTIEQSPSTAYASDIWLNIGKCRLRQHDARAVDAFLKSADLGTGGTIETVAHLYSGRLLLQGESPRRAVAPLRTAVDMAGESGLHLDATLLLATAYFSTEQNELAEDLLARNAEVLNKNGRKHELALLSGTMQLAKEQNHSAQERQAAMLLEAATNVDLASTFGEHNWLLACKAYHTLGFEAEARRTYERFRDEFGQDTMKTQYQQIFSGNESIGSNEELVNQKQLAEAAADQVILLLQDVALDINANIDERRAALRQLAKIHQIRGEHELAVEYLTGDIPPTNSRKSQ